MFPSLGFFFSKLAYSSWAHLSATTASITKGERESEQASHTAERFTKDGKSPKSLAEGQLFMTKFQFETCCFIGLSLVAHHKRVEVVPGLAKEVSIHDIFEEAILT